MPATNMNALMRSRRRDLMSYMYPSDASVSASGSSSGAADSEGAAEPGDSAAEDTGEFTILKPGEKDAPDMYTYSMGDNGAWMVYPPGVPCPTDEYRVSLDHPATAEELTRMQAALDTVQGEETGEPAASDTAAEEGAEA